MTNNLLHFVALSPLNLAAFCKKKELLLPRNAKMDLGGCAFHYPNLMRRILLLHIVEDCSVVHHSQEAFM